MPIQLIGSFLFKCRFTTATQMSKLGYGNMTLHWPQAKNSNWTQPIRRKTFRMESAPLKNENISLGRNKSKAKQNLSPNEVPRQPACVHTTDSPVHLHWVFIPALESFPLCLIFWENTDVSGKQRRASSDRCNFMHFLVTLSSITLQAWIWSRLFTMLFCVLLLIGSSVYSNWHLCRLKAVTGCGGCLPNTSSREHLELMVASLSRK